MLRITRQTDYGIILMTRLAGAPRDVHPAAGLAAATRLPLPMVSKVLKRLARHGLLVSQRGATGGYALAAPPESISVADLIAALEGPIALTECLAHDSETCDHIPTCPTRGHWHHINRAIQSALAGVTLADLCRSAPALVPLESVGLAAAPLPGPDKSATRRIAAHAYRVGSPGTVQTS